MITSRFSQSHSLLFSELPVSHLLLLRKKLEQPGASNTAQQLLGLRTELNGRIGNFVMGNGLQEPAARNVLSKRSVLFKPSEPRRPLPSPALLQSETTNSFHTSCFLGNNLQLYWWDQSHT